MGGAALAFLRLVPVARGALASEIRLLARLVLKNPRKGRCRKCALECALRGILKKVCIFLLEKFAGNKNLPYLCITKQEMVDSSKG